MSDKSVKRRLGPKPTIILTEAEKAMIVIAFRSGNKTVKEICDKFGIYSKDVKRIVEEAGYTY